MYVYIVWIYTTIKYVAEEGDKSLGGGGGQFSGFHCLQTTAFVLLV